MSSLGSINNPITTQADWNAAVADKQKTPEAWEAEREAYLTSLDGVKGAAANKLAELIANDAPKAEIKKITNFLEFCNNMHQKVEELDVGSELPTLPSSDLNDLLK